MDMKGLSQNKTMSEAFQIVFYKFPVSSHNCYGPGRGGSFGGLGTIATPELALKVHGHERLVSKQD
jgi:hypothetical protein